MLTVGSCHDQVWNPGSWDCKLSAPSLNYSVIPAQWPDNGSMNVPAIHWSTLAVVHLSTFSSILEFDGANILKSNKLGNYSDLQKDCLFSNSNYCHECGVQSSSHWLSVTYWLILWLRSFTWSWADLVTNYLTATRYNWLTNIEHKLDSVTHSVSEWMTGWLTEPVNQWVTWVKQWNAITH